MEKAYRPVLHITSTTMTSTTHSSPQDTTTSPSLPQEDLTRRSEIVPPRRPRPSDVQTTNLLQGHLSSAPTSAITTSSMASSPQQTSPILSPGPEVLTTSSSIQPSPEPTRGRGSEIPTLPSMEALPEPIISRKTSTNSLPQSLRSEQSYQNEPKQKGGIIRRISTRVKTEGSRLISRRTSSTHPVSRDTSVGPAVMRRGRSDSGVTSAAENGSAIAVASESDDEAAPVREQMVYSLPITEGEPMRDFSPTGGAPSIAATSTLSDIHIGPIAPPVLTQGTSISKVSTKRRKRINLALDQEAGKIFWDKNRPSKCVYIDDIKEIRKAPDVRQYRMDCGVAESEESRFFTILYAVPDRKQKTMHLIADNEEQFEWWVDTLDALSKHRQELMTSLMAFNDRAIKVYWRKEMNRLYPENPPIEEEIHLAGVERVCRNLHIHVTAEYLKFRFDQADKSGTGTLNYGEFQEFVRLMAQREDVRAVYYKTSSGHEDGLSFEDFIRFLRDVQHEDVSDLASKEAIFNQFSHVNPRIDAENGAPEQSHMSEGALARYLTSIHNTPIESVPQHCDLTRPVNEYYISSSHNTYLTGRQVADISSIEGYISALMRGCRCVEVDCWDGPDNQPVVTHGKTLTSQIQFREAIAAINKYAFVKSQYPLWVSLEVHCNPSQQEIMANIMKEIFGERLVTERFEDDNNQLPSPEQLKGRILVKCKSPNLNDPKLSESSVTRRRGNSLTSPFSRPTAAPETSIPNSPLLSPNYPGNRRDSNRRVNTINEGEISDVQDGMSSSSSEDSGAEKRSKQSKITKVLGDLGVYCLGIKFRGFDDAECRAFNHILSFKERTFLNNSSTRASKDALFRHNMRYLMRVYPGQHRITSNNFDPMTYWRRGVQMAALNWQTFDLGMQFNQAMFAGGKDGSGYVLKPRSFREIQMVSEELATKRERKTVSFTIDVISAQQLMRPSNLGERRTVDPYIEVEVFSADDKRDKQDATGQPLRRPLKKRTHVIKENGFNPVFNRSFSFDLRTKYPDLVFVRWSVKLSDGGSYNDRSPAVATYTAKLTSLKQGYRTLPLLDHNGDRYLFSTLFCHIKVEPMTTVFVDYETDGENSNKLKSLGRTVFNRKDQSPKTSIDKDTPVSSPYSSQDFIK